MDCPDVRVAVKYENEAPKAIPVLGQRATRQRRLICDILKASDDHLDVESLYRKARDIDARVSLSTVYRTISLLKESDLVDELVFEDDRRCYEFKKMGGHHHIRCLSCSEIFEFECDCTSRMQDKLGESLGFQVESVKIDVAGYCTNCRKG